MGKKKTRDALTYDTLPALFTGICDAIRDKTGGTDPIAHQSIPSAIADIPTGGSVEIAFNQTFSASAGQWSPTQSHTVENTGTLNIIMWGYNLYMYDTSEFFLKKNGTQMVTTRIYQTQGDLRGAQYAWNVSVTAGDVITLGIKGGGATANGWAMGIVTPAT